MPSLNRGRTILWMIVAVLVILACDASTLTSLMPGGVARPTVVIQSPTSGANFKAGDDVQIQSTATDANGIVRVELSVDGQIVSTDAPPIPQGQASFSVVQKWKATEGTHTISVRAFNASGAGSDPAIVALSVSAGSIAQASATLPPASPGAATPTGTVAGPTETISVARPTSTRAPATATRAAATNTPSGPPGVYAVSIRVDPPGPKVNSFVTFYVTFSNTTGDTKRFRWYVKIFRPDERNSFGETAKKDDDFPVGRVELQSPNNWRVGGFADCQPFFARAFWYDVDTTLVTEFLRTDGQSVNQGFNVCP
jgi:Big-like domain-containing protein